MRTRKQKIFVGALFVLVFTIFSLADQDTKRNDPNYRSSEQKVQALSSSITAPDSAKAKY